MGDRCTCYVTVPKAHKEQALEVLNQTQSASFLADGDDTDFTEIELCEVNYADLDDESNALRDLGIEHTIMNCAGSEYGEGWEHLRFTEDGTAVRTEYLDAHMTAVPIHALEDWIKQVKDVAEIQEKLKQHQEYHSTPDWDMTLKNGKRYLLTKMVKP